MHALGWCWILAGFFFQFLNLITMNISKIKSFVFGLAFLGSMGFGGITSQAQTELGMEGGGGTCYQRMARCSGVMTVYHCDGQRTSESCGVYYVQCKFC
jgi:hypothetical protein